MPRAGLLINYAVFAQTDVQESESESTIAIGADYSSSPAHTPASISYLIMSICPPSPFPQRANIST